MVTDDHLAVARAVDEVRSLFARYEAALVIGDVDAMNSMFWANPEVVRYGIADAQVGFDELVAWRRSQPALPPGRTLSDTVVAGVSSDVVVVSTSFAYPGSDVVGRQSQTWVRLPEGWRIVAAHVSEIPT